LGALPPDPTGAPPLDPAGGLLSPDPSDLLPPEQISSYATARQNVLETAINEGQLSLPSYWVGERTEDYRRVKPVLVWIPD